MWLFEVTLLYFAGVLLRSCQRNGPSDRPVDVGRVRERWEPDLSETSDRASLRRHLLISAVCVFTTGVCNTDNFSLLSVTIDYGPFGFMEQYDPSAYDDSRACFLKVKLNSLPSSNDRRKLWCCRFCPEHIRRRGQIQNRSSGRRRTVQPGEAPDGSRSCAFWKTAERVRRIAS